MAGHSHASNVKYKKDRNDKLKSESFLKMRRKIELAYSSTNDREKIFSIAKKCNFPKEKVNLIIEKVENSRRQCISFKELLYRGKYEILIYLRGNLSEQHEVLLERAVKNLSLEKLHSKRPQDYFYSMYLLEIDVCTDVEEIVFSSLSTLVIDKIIKIEKKEGIGSKSGFEILFSEKGALTETIRLFTDNRNIRKLKSREIFSPFLPVYTDSDDLPVYFSSLESNFSELGKSLQIFTNISGRKKWDHSSVG